MITRTTNITNTLQSIALGPSRLLEVRGPVPIDLTFYDGDGRVIGGFAQDQAAHSVRRVFDVYADTGIFAVVRTPYPLTVEFE